MPESIFFVVRPKRTLLERVSGLVEDDLIRDWLDQFTVIHSTEIDMSFDQYESYFPSIRICCVQEFCRQFNNTWKDIEGGKLLSIFSGNILTEGQFLDWWHISQAENFQVEIDNIA